MKILVAGSSGFIGTNLCLKLTSLGYQVVGVDNFITGTKENLNSLLSSFNFEFVEHDIVTNRDFGEIDAIINLACPASPVGYQNAPIETLQTNFIGTLNLLNLAKKYNAKFIQASTSEVYGDPEMGVQSESYWGRVNPIGIRSCYDEGKRVAESLIMEYHRQFNLDVKIFRIFNTYGPFMRVDDGRVVSNFIYQALTNQGITIYGDGMQTRSFQYISDLVEAFTKVLDLDPQITGPINVGNPGEFSMLKLANFILDLVPESTSKLIYHDLPQDDPKKRKPDISYAQQILDWSPKISLEEGLKLTINYFQTKL